jgi:hypothetical protein
MVFMGIIKKSILTACFRLIEKPPVVETALLAVRQDCQQRLAE